MFRRGSNFNAVSIIAIVWGCIAHGYSPPNPDARSAAGDHVKTRITSKMALMPLEHCEDTVRNKNLLRNVAGLGPIDAKVVTRYFERYCNTTNNLELLVDLPGRTEHALGKDLSATQRFFGRGTVAKYVRMTYPSMSRRKQIHLVASLMAAKALDEPPAVESAEVSNRVRLVN